jgi:hypothetical protein
VHIVLNTQVGLMGAVSCASQLWARVDWILPTAAAIEVGDQKNVLHHGFPALGRAWGGLDVIFGVYQQKPLESRKNAEQQLEKALLSC